MAIPHKLTRLLKRVILPFAALIYILLSFFDLHTRNIYNNQFKTLEPYLGGPIDDIKRIRCYSWYGSCNQIIEQIPDAQDEGEMEEVIKIKKDKIWHRIPKSIDINGEKPSFWNFYQEFLYVHHAPENTPSNPIKAITDIAIGEPDTNKLPNYVVKDLRTSTGKPRSRMDITNNFNTWEQKHDGIWVKYDKPDTEEVIRDIMYLFGEDPIEPRSDWTLVTGKFHTKAKSPISLTVLRGKEKEKEIPIFKESQKGEFKVLQISDMHFISDFGVCKDQMEKDSGCKADVKTLNFLHQVLDSEKPDLVVITGDIIDGFQAFDYQTALLKALSPFITRSIPYAVALGENDKSHFATRYEFVDFITSLPFSVMSKSKNSISEITNYVIQVKDKNGEELKHAIYILDLYTESQKGQAINHIKNIHDHFVIKPKLSLQFQHHPIKEFRPKGEFAIVGNYNERHRLVVKTDPETIDALNEIGANVISVGSEHTNECCIQSNKDRPTKLWMCFSGGVGEGGYFSTKLDRRVRFFRLNSAKNEITSWKRRQGNPSEVFDYQYISQASG